MLEGGGVVGGGGDGPLVGIDGAGGVLHGLHDFAVHLKGQGAGGVDALDLGQGLLGELEVELAEEVPGFLVLGVGGDDGFELGDGLGGAVEGDQGAGEGDAGEAVGGHGGDAGLEGGEGLVGLVELEERGAEHDLGGVHVGGELEALGEDGDGVGEAIEIEEETAEVVVGRGDGGVEFEDAAVVLDGLVGVMGGLRGLGLLVEGLDLRRLGGGEGRKREQRGESVRSGGRPCLASADVPGRYPSPPPYFLLKILHSGNLGLYQMCEVGSRRCCLGNNGTPAAMAPSGDSRTRVRRLTPRPKKKVREVISRTR